MSSQPSIALSVVADDALGFRSDVLVLKYAQALHGVDKAAYARLGAAGIALTALPVGTHRLLRTGDAIASKRVLFIGVAPLPMFDYTQIREFGRRAMEILATEHAPTRVVTLTLHGAGFGLDELEAFRAELAGVMEAIAHGDFPAGLEGVTFVERDGRRAERLAELLSRLVPTGHLERGRLDPLDGLSAGARRAFTTAGTGSAAKPRVFVAMPFADEMGDVFHYGIQSAVNGAGLLAERADLSSFTGDVMEWVRTRISSAELVIADLTSANPNVFLEVGYAWGKGVPTVLISRNTEPMKFDVQGQRCLQYGSIKDLEDKLARELAALKRPA